MKRICVVNINWLGDAIFTTPVFRALREAYPSARITCLCVPRVKEVLMHCPDIDDIIVYDEKGADRWPWAKVRLIMKLRRERFDAAFLLHRSLSRGLMIFCAGIPVRVGYTKSGRFLTHAVKDLDAVMHRSDHYLRAIESFGVSCRDRRSSLMVAPADADAADRVLKAAGIQPGDKFLVFNTGGNWDLKRWPLSHWADLSRRAAEFKIIFSGASKDAADVEDVIRKAGITAVNLAGKTTLGQSLAVFQRARAVVSADSGPLHLANAVGAAVVGIFGPTRQEVTGPRGMGESTVVFNAVGCNHAPCYHLACISNACMHTHKVEDVWQALQKYTT